MENKCIVYLKITTTQNGISFFRVFIWESRKNEISPNISTDSHFFSILCLQMNFKDLVLSNKIVSNGPFLFFRSIRVFGKLSF